MKLFFNVDSITMGINEWTEPQISEHCPKNSPGYLSKNLVWLIRPGFASTLIPNAGTAQECKTSAAVTRIRVCVLKGIIKRLFTSNKRNEFKEISFVGIIYESNSILMKSEYSYDQYHWCPIVLIVNEGEIASSSK